ncbi:putative regulator of G-protein signaling 7 [Triplophysa rosa]|uniref:Regulator of G-protein signaling 7 n=1 Tax=Triplophysa rosa TaxID=992332 RepID=A0A9W7TNL8_TRIRA|nr:putative regulator of G-protein signaling 7 [Triplophysa rosa]
MAQTSTCSQSSNGVSDEAPNMLVYRKALILSSGCRRISTSKIKWKLFIWGL